MMAAQNSRTMEHPAQPYHVGLDRLALATPALQRTALELALIAVSGSASDLSTGTLPNGRLSLQVVRNDFSYSDPSWITALNASKLIGSIADERLSANVPLLNAANVFVKTNSFYGTTNGDFDGIIVGPLNQSQTFKIGYTGIESSYGIVLKSNQGSGEIFTFKNSANGALMTLNHTGRLGLGGQLKLYGVSAGTLGIYQNDESTLGHLSAGNITASGSILTGNTTGGLSVTNNISDLAIANVAGLLTIRNVSGGAGIRFMDSGASSTEWARINNSGNVGIGITTPAVRLHVDGTAGTEAGGTALNGVFALGAFNSAGTSSSLTMGVIGGASAHSWIQARSRSSTATYSLSLNPSGGNVGIGTTTPASKLDVVGNITASGTLTTGYGNGIEFSAGGNSMLRSQATGVVTLQCQNFAGAGFVVGNVGGSVSTVPLTVRGAASQSANLQEWQNSDGTVKLAIDNLGSTGGLIKWPNIGATEKAGLDWFSQSVFGSRLRISGTDLTYYDTTTGFEVERLRFLLNGGINIATGKLEMPGSDIIVGAVGNTSARLFTAARFTGTQSDSLTFRTFREDGADYANRVTLTGGGVTAGAGTALLRLDNTQLLISSDHSPAMVPIIARGAASQTANLQQWETSAGTIVSRIDSTGAFICSSGILAGAYTVSGGSNNGLNSVGLALGAGKELYWPDIEFVHTTGGRVQLFGYGAATKTEFVVKGVASQTANLQEWQDSTGSALVTVGPRITSGNATLLTVNPAKVLIQNSIVKVYGYAASYFDLMQSHDPALNAGEPSPNLRLSGKWNSGGTISEVTGEFGVTPTGATVGTLDLKVVGSTGLQIYRHENRVPICNINSVGMTDGQLNVTPNWTGKIGVVVRGVASQSANLQEWQTSAGTVVASVSPAGKLTVNGPGTGATTDLVVTGAGGVGASINLAALGTGGRSFSFVSTASGTGAPGCLGVFDNTAGAYRTFLNATGDFGIGTTSPGSKLDVVGSITASGQLSATKGVFRNGSSAANYATRVPVLEFFRTDFPATYGNKISSSHSGAAAVDSTLTFEVCDGTASGYVQPLTLSGDGSATFRGNITASGTGTFNGLTVSRAFTGLQTPQARIDCTSFGTACVGFEIASRNLSKYQWTTGYSGSELELYTQSVSEGTYDTRAMQVSRLGVVSFEQGVTVTGKGLSFGAGVANAPLAYASGFIRTANDYRMVDNGSLDFNNAGGTYIFRISAGVGVAVTGNLTASGTINSTVASTATTHIDCKVTGSASAFKVDSTYGSAGFSHATIYTSGQATWSAGIGHVFIGNIACQNLRSYSASGTDNLGTSGSRWANVYSVNGDFSGNVTSVFQSLSADPTTLDLTAGQSRLVKNTVSGLLGYWSNDAGVIKYTILSPTGGEFPQVIIGAGTTSLPPLKFTAGPLNTTPQSGAMEFDGDSLYFTEAGVRRSVVLADSIRVTSSTVTNTTTETTIHTSAVASNELKVGKMYKLTLLGKTTTGNASQFFTLRFKMGGTTLISIAMDAASVTDSHMRTESYVTIRTTGVSGTYAAHVEGTLGNQEITASPVTGNVDTTIAEDMTVTLQWDAVNAGNVYTAMQSVLEVIG